MKFNHFTRRENQIKSPAVQARKNKTPNVPTGSEGEQVEEEVEKKRQPYLTLVPSGHFTDAPSLYSHIRLLRAS